MALVTLYVENKKFHTYDGTSHNVYDLEEHKELVSVTSHYAEAYAWAVGFADDILDGKTELAAFTTNVDTSIELVAPGDYKEWFNFSSDSLINLVFGALNKKVADQDVKAFIIDPSRIRHFSEKFPARPPVLFPRLEMRHGHTGIVHLKASPEAQDDDHPEAVYHYPYALYKHLTTPYA